MYLFLIIQKKEESIINITNYIMPLLIAFILLYGFFKKVDLFNEFLDGAWNNIKVGVQILPALLGLMLCINMIKASGAVIYFSNLIKPLTDYLGFPNECVSLALIRPISGSGGLALFQNVLKENGPDSLAGRVASVLMGSSETTFYTIAVYYGVTKVKKTRQTLAASLSADFTGFVFSALIVRLMFY